MFEISKEFHFCAAHFLRDMPEGHKCGRIHGHNYVVELILSSLTLDQTGFVREFCELDQFKNYLDETLDHRLLNDIAPFDVMQPTTENLARHLFYVAKSLFPELIRIRVSETPKTWVTFSSPLGTDLDPLTPVTPEVVRDNEIMYLQSLGSIVESQLRQGDASAASKLMDISRRIIALQGLNLPDKP